jgi:hypothetical protein
VPDPDKNKDEEFLTPKDLQMWLKQEVADSTKALELRLQEATSLVTDYSQGKITPEEATRRAVAFDWRWGEALPGTNTAPGRSNEEILEAIDQARDGALRSRGFTASVKKSDLGAGNSR